MITIANALENLRPNASWVHTIETGLEWQDETQTQPTDAEITTEINRLQAEHDQNQYQRDRAQEYPPIVDQLDDIFHNGIDGWKASIQAVKDKYPKGSN
jgi:hypothetical protein